MKGKEVHSTFQVGKKLKCCYTSQRLFRFIREIKLKHYWMELKIRVVSHKYDLQKR
jgi:hypothetical protein